MSTEHPITPPLELVQQWRDEWVRQPEPSGWMQQYIATQAARWGADQELEACCEWLTDWRCNDPSTTMLLRADRRPKPPSLKEQALDVLSKKLMRCADPEGYDTIRRALEALSE